MLEFNNNNTEEGGFHMNALDYQHVFHEIKNTVTLINSSAQLLNTKCPQLNTEPYWDNMKHEITYLKNMVLEISQAGSAEQLQNQIFDVNTLLKDICRFMKDAYPDMEWNLQLSERLPSVYADNIKLKQAILNLLKNSAETDSEYVTIETLNNDDNIKVIITDGGGGIPVNMEDKVFDLFTTSKEQGTGLGLAIARQIIEFHSGSLLLDNRPGEGCTFTITLPASNG